MKDNFYTLSNVDFYANNLYSDLDHVAQEIRLLELTLGKNGGPLRVILRSSCLTSSIFPFLSYCAISYCAGTDTETEMIYVEDIPFNAFANLASAIKQVATARLARQLRSLP